MIDSATLYRWHEALISFASQVRDADLVEELNELAKEIHQRYLDALRRETSAA